MVRFEIHIDSFLVPDLRSEPSSQEDFFMLEIYFIYIYFSTVSYPNTFFLLIVH